MTDNPEQDNHSTPQPPPNAPPPTAAEAPDKDAKMWGMLCHISALAGLVVPMGHLLGPLICWLLKKNDYPFVADQGKESLNFQITVTIAIALCIPLMLICIGVPLAILIGVGSLVFAIIAAIKSNDGETYRYPVTLRLIK